MIKRFSPTLTTLEKRDCPSYICSVTSFGAIGDGNTDSTAAIQSAINSVPQDGGTVVVPDGNYRISNPLIITTPNTNFMGYGADKSELQLTPDATNELMVIGTGQTKNINIIGLHIDGNHNSVVASNGTNFGIFVAQADTVNINHTLVTNFLFDGIEIGGGHSTNVIIDHDVIGGCGRNEIAIGYADNVAITNCYFDQTNSQYWGNGGSEHFQNCIDVEVQFFDAHINNVVVQNCNFNNTLYSNPPPGFYVTTLFRHHKHLLRSCIDVIHNYGPTTKIWAINNIVNDQHIKITNLTKRNF